ncbi:hypothetical protein UCD39_25905 [Nitrospirillum sp. BR 11752]|uniref:hypothetical protein n=1 Tax=Nitrospirillum sp. BR 11752 TaxID=3104293 RepID=UPI002EB5CCEB|nr:hypothetical protein [Nitrospirillum sp. BR 11752]
MLPDIDSILAEMTLSDQYSANLRVVELATAISQHTSILVEERTKRDELSTRLEFARSRVGGSTGAESQHLVVGFGDGAESETQFLSVNSDESSNNSMVGNLEDKIRDDLAAVCYIEEISGRALNDHSESEIIISGSEDIVIRGWAYSEQKMESFELIGVRLVGEASVLTRMATPSERADVASHFHSSSLLMTGFFFCIDRTEMSESRYDLEIFGKVRDQVGKTTHITRITRREG